MPGYVVLSVLWLRHARLRAEHERTALAEFAVLSLAIGFGLWWIRPGVGEPHRKSLTILAVLVACYSTLNFLAWAVASIEP